MNAFARPAALDEAISALRQGDWRILAGGTDLYPLAAGQLSGNVLDLGGIGELHQIALGDDLKIGSCVTWSEIADAQLPIACRSLQQAARQVGGRQIQNSGTIGGNLCNASPAADGVPPLLTLDATVHLLGTRGRRSLKLADFLLGPRRTAREADEVLTHITIPSSALAGKSAFLKLGARSYLVISIAMVSARVLMAGDRISAAALAVGACSATARRLPKVEQQITGMSVDQAISAITETEIAPLLAPIADVRATAEYRITAATELLRRAVHEAAK